MAVAVDRPALEPIRTPYRVRFLGDDQLDRLQAATLRILEDVGVKFPSADGARHPRRPRREGGHGQPGRPLPAATSCSAALSTAPRYFTMGARVPEYDLHLEDGVTYFTTDGCGVATIDFDTREERPSRKSDVGEMARVADYLPSIGFYWPMVSAQDHGRTAPLHEVDASFNNTVKHVQTETVMGAVPARYVVEMSTVIAGSREAVRERPPFSDLICTIAPLVQDHDGIEAALVLAEAGIPVGFLAMPTLGTTAPATLAGAFAVGDAEVISAAVLAPAGVPGLPGVPLDHAGLGRPAERRVRDLLGRQPHPLRAGRDGAPLGPAVAGGLLRHRFRRRPAPGSPPPRSCSTRCSPA